VAFLASSEPLGKHLIWPDSFRGKGDPTSFSQGCLFVGCAVVGLPSEERYTIVVMGRPGVVQKKKILPGYRTGGQNRDRGE